MTQITHAGEHVINVEPFSAVNQKRKFQKYSERGLALAVALGLHAAILPWLLDKSSAVPPVTSRSSPPMQIEISAESPVTPEPAPTVVEDKITEKKPDAPPINTDEAALKAVPKKTPMKAEKKALPDVKHPPVIKHHRAERRPEKTVVKKTPQVQPKPQAPHSGSEHSVNEHAEKSTRNTPATTPPSAGASYLHNPAPEYPDSAQERGLEGTVLLRVSVDAGGKATDVQIYKSSGTAALDDAAVRTVRHWSFVPAKRGAEPVSGQVIVPVDFSLN